MTLHFMEPRLLKEGTGRVARFELVPLGEMGGLPRVDVLVGAGWASVTVVTMMCVCVLGLSMLRRHRARETVFAHDGALAMALHFMGHGRRKRAWAVLRGS